MTREEIATTERILRSIEPKGQVMASVSQWLLIWQEVRELSFRLEGSDRETRKAVARDFKRLLDESIRVGKGLAAAIANGRISTERMAMATGCSRKSVVACIGLLEDISERHFGKPVSLDLVKKVWAEFHA